MSKHEVKTHKKWSQTLDQNLDDQIVSMAHEKVQIYNTCRVCMESNIELKSIYTKRNEAQIVDLISNLTDQPILQNDGLPEQICEDCFHKVYEANETRKMCRTSDKRLKQLLIEIQAMSELSETPSNWPTTEKINDQKYTKLPLIKPEPANNTDTEYGEMIVATLESSIEDSDESDRWDSPNENHRTEETFEWACCMCINLFDTKKDLLAHVANSHEIPSRCPQPGKKVECRMCLKRFTRIKNYNSHIKAIYEEKKLCPICGVAMQQRYLSDHILAHDNPKAVKKKQKPPKKRYTKRDKKCTECGKCFFYNAQLQTHIKAVHQGEKPYKCEICGLAYPYKDSLSTHLQKHSAERNFKCKICPATYIYRADLHFHMQRHYNGQARNFSCELCDFKFFTAKQLRAHSLTHDPMASWKCDLCEKSYRQQYTLAKHKFSEHQIPFKKRNDLKPKPIDDGRVEIQPVDMKCDYFDGSAEHYIIFQNE